MGERGQGRVAFDDRQAGAGLVAVRTRRLPALSRNRRQSESAIGDGVRDLVDEQRALFVERDEVGNQKPPRGPVVVGHGERRGGVDQQLRVVDVGGDQPEGA